ncbi:hypothetical protein CEE37_14775 [candidate division LCP-89 bacterium B3_LCP]|uniref:Uncharacterized protein n=1 Tax=candidate division LCP-89 bacterium B3_LCP TaxID=2012998 RepID=A0A532UPI4_UNCL8|nr:MAG: hypothetical protein CEE37_14775 [candidate division LCP-89 bacterium B3_LCP]
MFLIGAAGCYTTLHHPNVVQEDTGVVHEVESSSTSCTACHNNDYDHRWVSPHNWGFGYWGQNYPSYYNGYGYGYSGWQRYYYDPWWSAWYYDPWYYNSPGGGTYSPGVPPVERDNSRRGFMPAPMGTTPVAAPPPAYSPPPPQSQGDQQDSQDNQGEGRSGRRGK